MPWAAPCRVWAVLTLGFYRVDGVLCSAVGHCQWEIGLHLGEVPSVTSIRNTRSLLLVVNRRVLPTTLNQGVTPHPVSKGLGPPLGKVVAGDGTVSLFFVFGAVAAAARCCRHSIGFLLWPVQRGSRRGHTNASA